MTCTSLSRPELLATAAACAAVGVAGTLNATAQNAIPQHGDHFPKQKIWSKEYWAKLPA